MLEAINKCFCQLAKYAFIVEGSEINQYFDSSFLLNSFKQAVGVVGVAGGTSVTKEEPK